jgi:hypothetical protein
MAQAVIHSAVMYQSHRSGLWICEIYDRIRGTFVAVGLAQTRSDARAKAKAKATCK